MISDDKRQEILDAYDAAHQAHVWDGPRSTWFMDALNQALDAAYDAGREDGYDAGYDAGIWDRGGHDS